MAERLATAYEHTSVRDFSAKRKRKWWHWVLILPALLLYLPLLSVLSKGLIPANFLAVLQRPEYYALFCFTLLQAALSTLTAVLLALPVAYLAGNFSFRGKTIIRVLSLLPFVLPSILLVLGFVLVWGDNGVINRGAAALLPVFKKPLFPVLYTLPGIVMAHAYYNFGFCVLIISERWRSLPSRQIQAACNLGAGVLQRYRDIIFPHLRPALTVSASIVFLLCFTSFTIVLVLGGGPWHSTLEVAIYRLVRLELDVKQASSLALLQICLTLSVLLLYLLRKGKSGEFQLSDNSLPALRKSPARHWARVYFVLLYTFVLLPLAAIIIFSFQSKGSWAGDISISLEPYYQLFTVPGALRPLYNSVMLAASSSFLAFALASCISVFLYRVQGRVGKVVEIFLFLPYLLSPVILSFSYTEIRVFGGTFFILVLVHALLSLPLVTRILLLSFSGIKENLLLAAANLGASRSVRWRSISAPLAAPGIIAAISLSLCLSLGELSAVLMLADPQHYTIPVSMYQQINRYRVLDAGRLGVLLILCTAVLLVLLQKSADVVKRWNNARLF